jgi:hypothetical protein
MYIVISCITATCPYIHMSIHPYEYKDIIEKENGSYSLRIFSLYLCFVSLNLLSLHVLSFYTFRPYMFCLLTPFAVIIFFFLYALSLYVLSLNHEERTWPKNSRTEKYKLPHISYKLVKLFTVHLLGDISEYLFKS